MHSQPPLRRAAVAACFLAILSVSSPSRADDAPKKEAPAPQDGAHQLALPGPDDLPSVKELPDPFRFADGTRVKTRDDWKRRRGEIKTLVLDYEYGRMPAGSPGEVTVAANPTYQAPPESGSNAHTQPAATPAALPAGAAEHKLLLSMGPDGKIKVPLILTVPAGKGPFPVIVKGDLCWGRIKPETVADVVGRGYTLAEFDRTAVAPDNADRTVGVYPLYPDADWRALSAWAWGTHRVIDYLLTRPDIDRAHVVVTGHSRGGKCALLAGATDERIALTVPNNSGCGGCGSFRFQAPKSEDIAAITQHFPFWFSPRFPQFIGKVDKLPIDQHEVEALVAPRGLLSMEALGDLWANPEGTEQTYRGAKEVYTFLGAPDHIAIHYREGIHEQNRADFKALVDFADQLFFGKKSQTIFNNLAFPDAPQPFSWKAPAPEAAER